MHILIVYLTIVHAFTSTVLCSRNISCTEESLNLIDDYLRRMTIFGDPEGRYPLNEEELTVLCKKEEEYIKTSELYSEKCLRGTTRYVNDLVLLSVNKVLNRYCNSTKLRTEFISWGPCGNAVHDTTVGCWSQYIRDLEGVPFAKEDTDKVPLLCCNYHAFHKCTLDAYQDSGKKVCSERVSNGLDSLINDSLYDALQYMCAEYQDDNDVCDSVLEKNPKIEIKGPLPKSPLIVLIKVLENGFDKQQVQ